MKKVADLENQVEQETSEVNTEEVVEETVETENAEETETTEDKKAAKKADKKKAKVDKKADAKCEAMQAKIDELETQTDNFRKQLLNDHVDRLQRGVCKPENSTVFISLVSNLERCADLIRYVAHSIHD